MQDALEQIEVIAKDLQTSFPTQINLLLIFDAWTVINGDDTLEDLRTNSEEQQQFAFRLFRIRDIMRDNAINEYLSKAYTLPPERIVCLLNFETGVFQARKFSRSYHTFQYN